MGNVGFTCITYEMGKTALFGLGFGVGLES